MANSKYNKPIRYERKEDKAAEKKMLGYNRQSSLSKSKVKLPSRKDLESP